MRKINENKSCFFEKIKKIDQLDQEKKEEIQIIKIRSEIGDITNDFSEIKKNYKRIL